MLDSGIASNIAVTIAALIVVLGFAWLCLRVFVSVRRHQQTNRRMRIVEFLPFGGREKLVLVDVDGIEYLIGVSNSGVTLINTLPTDAIPTDAIKT